MAMPMLEAMRTSCEQSTGVAEEVGRKVSPGKLRYTFAEE